MKTPFTQRLLLAATIGLFFIGKKAYSQTFTENFDDINTLVGSGWFLQNNSTPIGIINWFQGSNVGAGGPFDSYNGATNSYIAANFNNTAGGSGIISNWLVTPNRTFRNGDVITFYTRKATGSVDYPDRLEVRLSTNGSSTNVGAAGNNVGDFTTLLTSVNPTLAQFGYPTVWTLYTITISGLAAPTSGRIAFRYFVTSAGPSGTNSDYIGIDNVVYTPYVCPTVSVNASGITNGAAGTSYNATVTGTGFLGAGYFAITAGSLPPGLTLNTNGNISGTPTATGTFNFTVSGSDASGCFSSASSSITISCPANVATFNSTTTVCTNDNMYTLSEGLPAGGTYSGTGVSGGIFDPLSGTQIITYDYTDPYGCSHSASGPITVLDPPVLDLGPDLDVCEGEQITLSGPNATVNTWDNGVLDATPFSPTATNIYTLTAVGGNGCTNSDSITVTVNPLPVLDLGPDITLCEGEQLTLSGPNATVNTWDNGVLDATPFTPTATNVYTLTAVNTYGCTNSASITVTVNPAPVFDLGNDIVSTDISVLIGGPAGMSNYVWSNGETTQSLLLNGSGSYWLTVTDVNGCQYTDTIYFTSTFSVEVLENDGISIYPNPTSSVVNINLKEYISDQVRIELFNVTGQKIIVKELNDAQNLQLSVEHLPSGVYFINVVLGSKNYLAKLIRK